MHCLIYVLVYVGIWSSLSCGQTTPFSQSADNTTSGHQRNNTRTVSQSTCSVEIENDSAIFLSRKILNTKAKFMPLLQFNLTESQYNFTKETIFPLRWAWKYRDTGHDKLMYVAWPPDYSVLSGQLLDVETYNEPIFINIKVHPAKCSLTFGQEDTVQAIMTAFVHFTVTYLVPSSEDYFDSYWCYLTEKSGVKFTNVYKLGLQLGTPVQAYGYKCCINTRQFGSKIKCSPDVIPFVRVATILPSVMGVILFFFFPIIQLQFFHFMVKTGASNVTYDLSGKKWLYISNHKPMSISKMLFGLCGLGDNHPILVSRVRRILYLIVLPSLLYFRIYLFYVHDKDYMIELVKHKIPLGFNSVIAGFKDSQDNFLQIVGGPWVFYISYIILGLIMLLVPESAGELLSKGLELEKTEEFKSILTMDLCTIEELSNLQFKHYNSYKIVAFALKAFCWMVINPKFWTYAVRFQIHRWKELSQISFNKYKKLTLKILLYPLYVLFCVAELLLALLYYGIPFVAFSITWLKAYMKFFHVSLRERYLFLRLIGYFVFSLGSLYFTFAHMFIMYASFTSVGKVLVYTYFALVIFPDHSFGYLFYAGSSVFYLIKIYSDFGNGYQKLLRDIINILEQSNETERVRYENNTAGIPHSLYTYMVNKHRPVYKHVLLSVFKILGIILLFYFSYVIYRQYNGVSNVLSLFNVVSVILIGAVPRLLESVYSNTEQQNKRRWSKLEASIANYYESDQSPNLIGAEHIN